MVRFVPEYAGCACAADEKNIRKNRMMLRKRLFFIRGFRILR
jgi:hypothetical protein